MDWGLFLTYFAACAAAGATGAMFQPGRWYDGLSKPPWTPPDWAFPVTWSILYILIALAGMRVAQFPDSGQAQAFWALQIALNTLWSPVFFGLHKMRAGLVIIVALWAAVAACVVTFWQIDTLAGAAMAPYLVWVTIAGALNASVLRRNPEPAA